jgi:hypothetical protein
MGAHEKGANHDSCGMRCAAWKTTPGLSLLLFVRGRLLRLTEQKLPASGRRAVSRTEYIHVPVHSLSGRSIWHFHESHPRAAAYRSRATSNTS